MDTVTSFFDGEAAVRSVSRLWSVGCALALGWVPAAPAAEPNIGGRSGACGSVDWLCVAECVDRDCVNACVGSGCGKAVEAYAGCARTGCPATDETCAAPQCHGQCRAAYGNAPNVATQGRWTCPRSAGSSEALPEGALGVWLLDGASIPPSETQNNEEGTPPNPRPDFRRRLNLLAGGCYAQEVLIGAPTLGPANRIVVRTYGRATHKDGMLTLTPEAREAESSFCGRSSTRPLTRRAMAVKTYKFNREGSDLSLADTGDDKQVLHFAREGEKK
ncbi:MAG TPA: hypothetical protein VEY30_03055 [Myxococcaceae bacterium]|nr:hypothetical protein [Myxococcaceae bacterium]